jgi:chromosome segregation ATPase
MTKAFFTLLIVLCFVSVTAQAATRNTQGKVFYRYKNNEGVLVMDNKVPAEYASKGYEIVSITGKVIKVVAPSLTKEEAEKQKAEKQAREERLKADIELKRSYSAVTDIDAAKERNLTSLQSNLAILRANLESTRQELAKETSRAAALERSGRQVNKDMLAKIESLQKKEKDIAAQVNQREKERQSVSDKFDQDRKRFIEITQASTSSSVSSQ